MIVRPLVAGGLSLVLGCAPADNRPGGAPDGGTTGSQTTDGEGTARSDASGAADACLDTCSTESTSGGAGGASDDDSLVDCDDPDFASDPQCTGATVRIATWNTLRVGPVGSDEYDAMVAIVARLDADVLCLQEIGEGEEPQLQALADATGYAYGLLAPASGPPGSGIANACMSRTPTADAAYLWSNWISSDPAARDLTRPFVRLRLYVPAADRYVSVLSGHLKAGSQGVDRFRRMVESMRLGQAAIAERTQYPNNVVVVLGDLNERTNPDASTFSSLPPGLPSFYNLGNDIALPFIYAPAQPLLDAGLVRVEARWEDSTEQDTFIPFSSRLDYIYLNGGEILASEVYEACRDDGIDAAPEGDVVSKAGEPLDCGLSEVASDHRPVVVEFRL